MISDIPWYLRDLRPEVYFDTHRWFVLDFETTNLEKGSALVKDNDVVLAAYGGADGLVHVGGISPRLQRDLARASILVAHNAKFELQWLNRRGVDTSHLLVLDTQIAEYVIAGNRRWELNLDATARRHGLGGKDPIIDALMRNGVCPSAMPRARLEARVRTDVEKTRELAKRQLEILRRDGLLGAFFTRCIFTPVLARIEPNGVQLDAERVTAERDRCLAALGYNERELGKLTGGINLGSGKQLAYLLYGRDPLEDEALRAAGEPLPPDPPVVLGFAEPRRRDGSLDRTKPSKQFPYGKRRTDNDTLESLKGKTKLQKRFIELRKEWGKFNARLTKALNYFQHVCDEDAGVMYASYNQTVTATHRLSSSGRRRIFADGFEAGAQLQNIPREYKKLFTVRRSRESAALGRAHGPAVPSDHVIIETDGSGIEFRAAGELAHDEQAIADIVSGADVHRYTASVLNGIPEADVTKDQRQAAKPDTFAPLYGAEYGTPEQVAYYEAFRAKYAGITRMQASWHNEVLRTKKLRTASGLILYWPNARVGRDGRLDGSTRRQVSNYPIQGFATADIAPVAITYLYWRATVSGIRFRMVNTVHDSGISEVHKDDVAEYTALAPTCWLDDVYRYCSAVFARDLIVPLGVGITVGQHWGEGTESKVSYARAA